MKEYNSEIARWKKCIGPGMEKGHRDSISSPGPLFSPNHQVFNNPEALQTVPFGFLWGHTYIGIID